MLCACSMFRRIRSSGAASIIAAKAAADPSPFSTPPHALPGDRSPPPLLPARPLPSSTASCPAIAPVGAPDDDRAAARFGGGVKQGGGCCGGGTQNGDRARSVDRGVGGSRRPRPHPHPEPGDFLRRSSHRPSPAVRGTPLADEPLFLRRPPAGEGGEPCLEEARRSGEAGKVASAAASLVEAPEWCRSPRLSPSSSLSPLLLLLLFSYAARGSSLPPSAALRPPPPTRWPLSPANSGASGISSSTSPRFHTVPAMPRLGGRWASPPSSSLPSNHGRLSPVEESAGNVVTHSCCTMRC